MAVRILVVNDDQDILDVFKTVLEDEGYEAILYRYLITDLSEIAQLNPDLIILDLMFDHQNLGWNLLQKLRMFPNTASIPVILCTAASRQVMEQVEYLKSKEIPIIFKPFDLDELLQAIHQQLAPPLAQQLEKADPPARKTKPPLRSSAKPRRKRRKDDQPPAAE